MTTRAESQPIRFLLAAAILAIALFAQIFLASGGWYINFSLIVLLALAFMLDFFELLVLDLVAVWLLNWQPAPSFTLLAFAVIPLGAFALRRLTHTETWVGAIAGVAVGLVIFYIIAVV